jgi:hypothetical protein
MFAAEIGFGYHSCRPKHPYSHVAWAHHDKEGNFAYDRARYTLVGLTGQQPLRCGIGVYRLRSAAELALPARSPVEPMLLSERRDRVIGGRHAPAVRGGCGARRVRTIQGASLASYQHRYWNELDLLELSHC